MFTVRMTSRESGSQKRSRSSRSGATTPLWPWLTTETVNHLRAGLIGLPVICGLVGTEPPPLSGDPTLLEDPNPPADRVMLEHEGETDEADKDRLTRFERAIRESGIGMIPSYSRKPGDVPHGCSGSTRTG